MDFLKRQKASFSAYKQAALGLQYGDSDTLSRPTPWSFGGDFAVMKWAR
jgi:hypothetical protein